MNKDSGHKSASPIILRGLPNLVINAPFSEIALEMLDVLICFILVPAEKRP